MIKKKLQFININKVEKKQRLYYLADKILLYNYNVLGEMRIDY